MLKNLINYDLVAASSDTPVPEIARLMENKNVGAILITEGGKPLGIVTDRDLVVRCISKEHDPGVCKASDVMTESVEFMHESDGLYACIRKMSELRVRRMPVVDESGRAVGIISFGDLLAILSKELSDLSANTIGGENFSDRKIA